MRVLDSLRAKSTAWISVGTLAGLIAGLLWMHSQAAWQRHLDHADTTGQLIYGSLVYDAPLPADVIVSTVTRPPQDGARITQASLLTNGAEALGGARIRLEVHDPTIGYPVGALPPAADPAARLGAVTRLMAQLCGTPSLYAQLDGAPRWVVLRAPDVWSCGAAPRDIRLPVALIYLLVITTLLSRSNEVTARLGRLARVFSDGRGTGAALLPIEGPSELSEIAQALNHSIAEERAALEKRAEALSAISHDLGTPAARLKLRTALIEDTDLRRRMEGDIDRMIAMVEGVLSFTRTELDAEAPQAISLTALVEAMVDDYADLGRPVTLAARETPLPQPRHSVFGVTPRRASEDPKNTTEARHVLITARPLALQRALTNLIDNALNYGRRAHLKIEAQSDIVTVLVEDAGGTAVSPTDMPPLIAPFRRGAHAGRTSGSGLGLSIVETVARQHGGSLSFEPGPQGLVARLTLRRA